MDKKESRLRRARQTRAKIAELKVSRLAVHRTNLHIYATIIGPDAKVLASASTAEAEVRAELAGKSGKGGNTAAATTSISASSVAATVILSASAGSGIYTNLNYAA